MSKFTQGQLRGASSLIADGLNLGSGHTLLLLFQTDLMDAAECIREAAEESGVKVDYREFKREDFFGNYPEAFSLERLTSSITKPSGIALLIEWSEETAKGRLALLNALLSEHQPWRIASMPGVDLAGLASCVSDFPVITDNCRAVFALIVRAKLAILQSRSPSGSMDTLKIPIGIYNPCISTGVIEANTWGNFPSGETFVVPNPFEAKGWVTVRGSIPSHPLKASDWIRFEIRRGRIRYHSIQASSPELKSYFNELFFNKKGVEKCENSSALAELGIGTNPGIVQLTGKPIFDEKKIGTVHIAFGKNDQFRGPLESCVHHDIICTDITLKLKNTLRRHLIRNYELVKSSALCFNEEQAVPKLDEFPVHRSKTSGISMGDLGWEYYPNISSSDETPKLSVEYASPRGIVSYQIASGYTATIANTILSFVEERRKQGEDSITHDELVNQCSQSCRSVECRRIIEGLFEYGLLKWN